MKYLLKNCLIIIICAVSITACSKEKEKIVLFNDYQGKDTIFHYQSRNIDSSLMLNLTIKIKMTHYVKSSFYIKKQDLLKKNKIACKKQSDRCDSIKITNVARINKAKLLIFSQPVYQKSDNSINITYSLINLKKGCQIYTCKTIYKNDFKAKSQNLKLINKISRELYQLIKNKT